jgi:hypothetical protein
MRVGSRIPAICGGARLINRLATVTMVNYRALVTARRFQIRGEERCEYSFSAPAALAVISVDVSPPEASTSPFWCARAAPRSSHKAGSSCEVRSAICKWRSKPPSALEESFDLVILSCKSYDLEGAMAAIAPAVGRNTLVLPLLNGLRHLDALDMRFSPQRVLGGCCHIGVALSSDGAIEHLNRIARFIYDIWAAREGAGGALRRLAGRPLSWRLSICSSMRDFGVSAEIRSLHLGFCDSLSRLKWHGSAPDSMG